MCYCPGRQVELFFYNLDENEMKKMISFVMLCAVAVTTSEVFAWEWRSRASSMSSVTPEGMRIHVSLQVKGDDALGKVFASTSNEEGTIKVEVIAPPGSTDSGGEVEAEKKTGELPVITGSSHGGGRWYGLYDPNPSSVTIAPVVQEQVHAPFVPLRGAWNW